MKIFYCNLYENFHCIYSILVLPSDCALHIRDAEFSWKDTEGESKHDKKNLRKEPGRNRALKDAPEERKQLNQEPSENNDVDRKESISREQDSETEIQGTTLSLVDICMHVTKVGQCNFLVFHLVFFFVESKC